METVVFVIMNSKDMRTDIYNCVVVEINHVPKYMNKWLLLKKLEDL